MHLFRYIIVNIIGTLLRGFPLSCKTGLFKIGNPDKNSPVFLTVNYCVTAERVKRILEKSNINCYLLIANSIGINVWCAAAGGHFTNHDVISILKTSGIEKFVTKRNVILPQLAAAGIESKVINKKIGWKVVWGPVYAEDIPNFVKNNFKKTDDMMEVKFPIVQRIEMAIMWAFPFSIIVAFIIFLFWKKMLLSILLLAWILPFLIFILFPLYSSLLNSQKNGARFSKYTIVFDFSRVSLVMEGIFILGLILYSFILGSFNFDTIWRWGFVSFVIVLLINIDLMGSTPVYKSGLHEDRFLKVVLDEVKCTGCGICNQVCPRNCYEIDKNRNIAIMPRGYKCVKCGACIIQCPFDALQFESLKGEVIPPNIIRKFKLNLLGKRVAK